MISARKCRAWACVVLSIGFLTGCFAHVEHLPKADPRVPSFQPLPQRSPLLVGIALSGGGSRAAYFGAAGLEALAYIRQGSDQPSLLEQVSHISSVSGGSLASSYYVTHKPPSDVRVLTPNGSLTPEYRSFFDQYRATMGRNYQLSLELRQFFNVRWFNSNQRATSLAEVLADGFLGDETFESFYEREKKGDSPRLIINTTLYNNGRRFILTTIPRDEFRYDLIDKLQKDLGAQSKDPAHAKEFPESLRQAQTALIPLTFQDVEVDPHNVPLSRAVAASASFPFFIGPITVQVQGKETYLHAGDGGLFDNQGTESLVQLFLQKLQEGKAKRALVLAFDSSFPFWVKNDTLDMIRNGFEIFTKDSGRIVGIMEQRANAYQSMVWHILQSQHIVLPDESTIKVIVLRHTDDVWTDPKTDLPEACRSEAASFKRKEDIRERLAMFPTLFKIGSECDKALLRTAAERVVEKKKDEIVSFFRTAKEN
jgi:predicted acylesterase/phospholipase RssA